jgi:outer membrane protein assembly factor BamE
MISPYSSRRFANLLGAGFAWLAVAAALLTLSACETTNNLSNRVASIVSPYKIDVVQGNFVSKEQAAALRPGMSRPQVRDVLGTPLLMSMFHGDRWDYVFTFQRQGVEPQSRRVTVYFKGDVLERFEAGELPTEAEFVASLDSGRSSGKVPVLEASEESLAKFGAANKAPDSIADAAQPTPALAPLPERYPPLESSGR